MPSSGLKKSALRSEEHTSELQSHDNLVSRLLLEKKKSAQARTRCHRYGDSTRKHLKNRSSPASLTYSWSAIPALVHAASSSSASIFFFNYPAPPSSSTVSLPMSLSA